MKLYWVSCVAHVENRYSKSVSEGGVVAAGPWDLYSEKKTYKAHFFRTKACYLSN